MKDCCIRLELKRFVRSYRDIRTSQVGVITLTYTSSKTLPSRSAMLHSVSIRGIVSIMLSLLVPETVLIVRKHIQTPRIKHLVQFLNCLLALWARYSCPDLRPLGFIRKEGLVRCGSRLRRHRCGCTCGRSGRCGEGAVGGEAWYRAQTCTCADEGCHYALRRK